MGDAHEAFVASMLRGRQSRGSGNQWRDQADGRHDRHEQTVAFGWDCKSTLGKSLSITTTQWEKVVDQSGMERPAVPLRFYHDPRLRTFTDLIAISLHDLAELLELAERAKRYDDAVENWSSGEQFGGAPQDGYDGPQRALIDWLKARVT